MKTSLIIGSAIVLALSITAEARMGAGGPGMSAGMPRVSGGDMRANTSNVGSPHTFSPDGRTFSPDGKTSGPARVTFSPDGRTFSPDGINAKPLKVKTHIKYKKTEDGENDPPEKEPTKPTSKGNGGGKLTGTYYGGEPSRHYWPGYYGYYGQGPHHGAHGPGCYYQPC